VKEIRGDVYRVRVMSHEEELSNKLVACVFGAFDSAEKFVQH